MSVQSDVNAHYDTSYLDLTKDAARVSAEIDLFKFENEIKPTDRVVDFGCGGGFILGALNAREKIGVEINPASVALARSKGLTIVGGLGDVEDDWADVIISHHALEHVDDPLGVIKAMRSKLRPGGKVVIVTPNESFKMRYRSDDRNYHLFTWSPSNLGNLLKRGGFARIEAQPVHHRWPPYWWMFNRVLPKSAMHWLCVANGRARTAISQVKAIGYK
ncbi:class I SAM-dependent methyltransferase [Mesorhizobium sp. CAU 1732]|uniref:class I SAM-dependent methyltransferase n=1 Tax=Mesorhizobium sp. CAU 1732 TaxID=3140358 RepID=UPI0032619C96